MLRLSGAEARLSALAITGLLLLCALTAHAEELTPAEQRGKLIYLQGDTESARPRRR